MIGTKTKGLNLNVKSKYKERLTKYVNNAAFPPLLSVKIYFLLPQDQLGIHAHGPKLPSPENVAGGAH